MNRSRTAYGQAYFRYQQALTAKCTRPSSTSSYELETMNMRIELAHRELTEINQRAYDARRQLEEDEY
jgi:hypothetical protein